MAPEDLESLTQNIQYLIIDWPVLDRDMIEYCHKKKINVFTYTMKDIDAFNYIKDFDIDGIISNYRLFRSKIGFMFTSY